MLGLNETQRTVLIEKVPDIANVAAGALIFGQSLGQEPFSPGLALVGVTVWLILMACVIALAKGDNT